MKLRFGVFAAVLGAAALAASGASANAILSGTTTTDNAFFAYVSSNNATLGTLIGSGTDWGTSYSVNSGSLSPGTYFLQIEGINQGGPAGLSGVFNLSSGGLFLNGTQTLTTDPSNLAYWLGSYNNSNSSATQQAWVQPTGAVYQDTSFPWGNKAGTPNWIWASDSLSNPGGSPCGLCTVDFSTQFTVSGSPTAVPEPLTLTLFGAGLAGAVAMRRRKAKA